MEGKIPNVTSCCPVFGIDPGRSGAIACEYRFEYIWLVLANAEEKDILDFFGEFPSGIAYLEKVHASPNMGCRSVWTFSASNATLRTAAIASGHDLHTVTPQSWQKELGIPTVGGGFGVNATTKKRRNKDHAQRLFPGIPMTDAIADAFLILHYATLQSNA